MANQEQAHARSRRLREIIDARIAAEANGEVSAADLKAAHERNAALRRLAQASASGAAAASDTPRRAVNSETWPTQ